MAKKAKVTPGPTRAQVTAAGLRLPCITTDNFNILADALTKLGAKFEILRLRANDFEGGRKEFGMKVTATGFTVIVDFNSPVPPSPSADDVKPV